MWLLAVYVAIFLVLWMGASAIFTILLWPMIARRLERDYPEAKDNAADYL